MQGNDGIMEKNMETTKMGYIGYILGLYRDNGKENGDYHLGGCYIIGDVLGFRVKGLGL